MEIKQELSFRKVYKKMSSRQKWMVDNAIREIIKNPYCGEQKKQDLANVYVYKFKIDQQLYLLAYEFDPETLILLLLGVHENFYKNLKIKL